jgi:mRNA interferase MazF
MQPDWRRSRATSDIEVKFFGPPASVALADQVRSFDWRARNEQMMGKAAPEEMAEIRAQLHALIG